MSKSPVEPVFLPNGVARNPLGSKDDDPESEVVNAMLDLVCCIRGETLNRDLGDTDHFVGVGEWGMALDSLEVAIQNDFPLRNPWISAAYERANRALPKNAEGYRD